MVALCSLLGLGVMVVVWAAQDATPNALSGQSAPASGSGTLPIGSAAPAFFSDAIPAAQVYVVQAGDTLTSIAVRFYDDAALWPHVYEANRDRISDPDNLRIGTEVRIPPRPSG
jgi:nucleoid-associated protein YgaU